MLFCFSILFISFRILIRKRFDGIFSLINHFFKNENDRK